MSDSNLLVWMMRLQQTEALLIKRKDDLQGHQQRSLNLQAELDREQSLSVCLCCSCDSHTAEWPCCYMCASMLQALSITIFSLHTLRMQQCRILLRSGSSQKSSHATECSCSMTSQQHGRTWQKHKTLQGQHLGIHSIHDISAHGGCCQSNVLTWEASKVVLYSSACPKSIRLLAVCLQQQQEEEEERLDGSCGSTC
jgi:hypothetical protein